MVLLSVLIAMSAMAPAGMHILLPSLPAVQAEFGIDYATVQQALTFYILALSVGQLIHGPLSDRFGRRPVVLGGLLVFLAGSLICMLADSIEVLVGGRILQALGGCSGIALGRAIIRDLYDRDRAASMIAWVTMAIVLAPMLSPTIGGYIYAWFGWRACFVFLLGFGAVVWLVVLFRLEETNPVRGKVVRARELVLTYGYLLKRREFLGYAFVNALLIAAFFAFLGSAPYVMVTLLGYAPSEYGLYFMGVASGFMIGTMVAGRISTRIGTQRMVLLGCGVSFFGALLQSAILYFGPLTPLTFFAPMLLVTTGGGIALPNAFAGAVSVDPTRAGAASGLTGSMQMALGALCSYVVASIITDSALPIAVATVILTAMAGLSYLWGVRGRV